jgi:pilus assembly protein CpaB
LKRSNRLILLVGIFLAVIAFIGIFFLLQGQSPQGGTREAPQELPTVLATQDIELGATVTSAMVTTQVLPIDARQTGAYQDVSQVIGQTVRQDVISGAQITPATFSAGGTAADIARLLEPGQRAISVQVDQVTGVGTVIKPGDYVDMVVGFTGAQFPVVTVGANDEISVVAGLNSTSVKLLLEGMQVVGTQLPPPPAEQGQQTGTTEEPGTALTGQQEIVMLSVTAAQSEVIKFSQMDGNITLILRSPKDFFDEQGNKIVPAPAGTQGVTLRKLVDELTVPIPELVEAILPTQR